MGSTSHLIVLEMKGESQGVDEKNVQGRRRRIWIEARQKSLAALPNSTLGWANAENPSGQTPSTPKFDVSERRFRSEALSWQDLRCVFASCAVVARYFSG